MSEPLTPLCLTDARAAYLARQAAAAIAAIRPYLLVKAEQADLALEFQELMRAPGRPGLTEFEWSERRRLSAAIKDINYGPKEVAA